MNQASDLLQQWHGPGSPHPHCVSTDGPIYASSLHPALGAHLLSTCSPGRSAAYTGIYLAKERPISSSAIPAPLAHPSFVREEAGHCGDSASRGSWLDELPLGAVTYELPAPSWKGDSRQRNCTLTSRASGNTLVSPCPQLSPKLTFSALPLHPPGQVGGAGSNSYLKPGPDRHVDTLGRLIPWHTFKTKHFKYSFNKNSVGSKRY